MSIFSRARKAIGRAAKKVGRYSGVKTAEGLFRGLKGGGGQDEARSDAATGLVRKNVTRQAGSGAINFNTEEEA
jgi:hypothetical protein